MTQRASISRKRSVFRASETAKDFQTESLACSRLDEFAYQLLRQLTGRTIGLLHTSWLEHKNQFSIGRRS